MPSCGFPILTEMGAKELKHRSLRKRFAAESQQGKCGLGQVSEYASDILVRLAHDRMGNPTKQ